MKKVSLQIGVTALVLLIASLIVYLTAGHAVIVVARNPGLADTDGWQAPPEALEIRMETEGVAEAEAVRISGDTLKIRLRALAPGETFCQINKAGSDDVTTGQLIRVNARRFIRSNDAIIGGLAFYIIAAGLFLAAACCFFLRYFFSVRGSALYSYLSIFSCGMAIFTGVGAVSVLIQGIMYVADPLRHSELQALGSIAGTFSACMWYLSPLILAFSAAMIVSNVALLRHESARLSNVLGIGVGVAMIAGLLLPFLLGLNGFSGSFEEYRLWVALENIYDTVYTYFAYMLAGSVICGIRAVRRKVPYDRDYIVILGCGFNADGSLTPLLRGRCDRAADFREEQRAATGREAILIPSGGQGDDEPMPEAEAMARYLVSRGVPESAIIREDRSRNTAQNMAFSKQIIDAADPQAKVAFSTTNYHVFRSGLLTARAGLDAEGIGARTKWWFWPNASMREVAGLMASRVREELILLAVTVAVSILLSWLTIR